MAAVVPGRRCARSSSSPAPVQADTATVATPGAMASTADQSTVDVVGEVGLVQDDDRRHLAGPGDREVAFDPTEIEVVVEARDEQRDVDVRRHDLLVIQARPAARGVRLPSA